MKAELIQELELVTTPQELKELAELWQKQIENNNYKEKESVLTTTVDKIRLRLKVDSKRYFHETNKLISTILE